MASLVWLALHALGAASGALAQPAPLAAPAADAAERAQGGEPPAEVHLGVVAQLRASAVQACGRDSCADSTQELEVRRLRVSLRGRLLAGRLSTLLQVNLSPQNPELVDLWAEYALRPALGLRVGQTKIPFTLHRARSFTELPTADWDPASVALGAERQLGLLLHDAPRATHRVPFGLGLFAGPSARPFFARGVADSYGEPAPHRSSLRSAPGPMRLHPELVGRLGAATHDMDANFAHDAPGLRAYAGLSAAWDARPAAREDFVTRLAGELLLKVEGVTLDTVGYAATVEVEERSQALGMLGATSELTLQVHPRLELAARYSHVARLAALREAVRTSATGPRGTHEATLAARATLLGPHLALLGEAAHLRDVRAAGVQDRLRLRLQLQLAF